MKKFFTLFLFTVPLIVVMLLATTEVIAQQCSDPPTMCTTSGGWRIFAGEEIDGITYGECTGDAITEVDHDSDSSTPKITVYPCNYVICKPNTGPGTGVECNSGNLNHVLMSVKKCCPEDIEFDLQHQDSPTVLPYGGGDPVFGWLTGYYQARVLRIPPQNSAEHVFGVRSSTRNTGETSICLKSKNSLECCNIIGLECPKEFAQSAVNSMTYVTTEDGRLFKQMLDPATQCPTEIWEILPCVGDIVSQGSEDIPCKNGFYQQPLTSLPIEQVLTATHDPYGDSEIISIANPGSGCGGAIVESKGEHSWFFCFLGRCWFIP